MVRLAFVAVLAKFHMFTLPFYTAITETRGGGVSTSSAGPSRPFLFRMRRWMAVGETVAQRKRQPRAIGITTRTCSFRPVRMPHERVLASRFS